MKRIAFVAVCVLIFGAVLTVPLHRVSARPTGGDARWPGSRHICATRAERHGSSAPAERPGRSGGGSDVAACCRYPQVGVLSPSTGRDRRSTWVRRPEGTKSG